MKLKLLILALILGMIGMVSGASSSDLQLHYTFNGSCDPQDVSGNGNDGVCQQSPSTGLNGQFDDAYGFVNGPWIDVPKNFFSFDFSTSFSVAGWCKVDKNTDVKEGYLLYAGNHDIDFRCKDNNNHANFRIYDGSVTSVSSSEDLLGDLFYYSAVYNNSNGEMVLYVNGSQVDSIVYSGSGPNSVSRERAIGSRQDTNEEDKYDVELVDEFRIYSEALSNNEINNLYNCNQLTSCNNRPQFDSVSFIPSTWTLNNDVDVDANVSDSDGTVQSVEADVYEDGTQIVSGQSLTKNSGTWEADNLFTLDETNVYYNVTLTATDDDGDNTTYKENQFITDSNPSISLTSPNADKFQYNNSWNFSSNNDGDDVLNEGLQCTVSDSDGQFASFTVAEGNSRSGFVERSLGSYSPSVSCTEQKGDANTGTDSTSYSVNALKFNSVSSASSSFETVDEQYTVDRDVGGMVNTVDLNLVYKGNTVNSTLNTYNGKSFNEVDNFRYSIGLVSSDGTDRNWNISADVNYTKLNGNYATKTVDSSTKTQTVDQAYKFDKHELVEGFTQLEASKLEYTASVEQKTGNAQGSITGETTYNQTGTTKSLNKETGLNYSEVFNTDLISSTSKDFELDTVFNLSFNGDSRTFSDTKTISLDKIVLSDNSNDGPETLKFSTKDEVNKSGVKSVVNADLKVSNPDQPSKTRVYGFNLSGSSTHSIYLSPGYGEFKLQSFKTESINYQDVDNLYSKRRYYLLDERIDNQTTDVNLYLLRDTETSNIEITLQDSDFNGLGKHIVRIERDFSGQNESRVVAMARTDVQGKANVNLDPDEQYIFTVFNEEGELVEQIGPQAITSLNVELTVDEDIPPGLENLINEVRFTDIVKQNQSLIVEYVSETERLNNLSLTVSEDNLFDSKKLDSDSSSQLQGRLKVSNFNASKQKLFYELEGTFGEQKYTLNSGNFGTDTATYGDTGVFMSIIMFLTLTMAGIFRPSASIGLGLLAVFVSAFIGFIPIGQTALISITALGAVMIWRIS